MAKHQSYTLYMIKIRNYAAFIDGFEQFKMACIKSFLFYVNKVINLIAIFLNTEQNVLNKFDAIFFKFQEIF